MFVVVGIMFGGVFVGYLLRRFSGLRILNRSISVTICLLLFLMGIGVGNNEILVKNLPALGGEALAIATAATLGSVIMAWVVYRFFFKEEKRHEE